MSSLRKALKSQKTHRERHQPDSRQQLGLLEKKKDYRIRAKNYNEKKGTLKKLRKQALDKNPDEFYFHMINSEMRDGVHKEKVKKEVMTPEQIKLMQTQDLRYVVYKRTLEKQKISKLKASLHMLDVDGKPSNTHTFFVDSEKDKMNFDVAKSLNTHPSMLGRSFNRPNLTDLASSHKFQGLEIEEEEEEDLETMNPIQRAQYKSYKELKQRIEREKQLAVVQEKMEVKRFLNNKKDKPQKLVKEETQNSAPVVKFQKIRKR